MDKAIGAEGSAPQALLGQQPRLEPAHISSFDVLRMVAAVAVVWIHAAESASSQGMVIWSRFAVPAFTATSVFLMALSVRQKSLSSVLASLPKRAWSIYRLFLIWNVFALLARLAQHRLLGEGHPIQLDFSRLFVVGLADHLWYLPFLALLGVVLALPARGFMNLKPLPAVILTLPLLLGCVGAGLLATSMHVDEEKLPLTYFSFLALSALPSALVALPIAWLWNQRGKAADQAAVAVAAALLAGFCIGASASSSQANLWHNLAGIFLLAAALFYTGRGLANRFRVLGELALPVYLVHRFLIDGFHAVGHRLHLGPSSSFDLAVFLSAVFGSLLLAYFLTSHQRLAWLVSIRPIQRR